MNYAVRIIVSFLLLAALSMAAAAQDIPVARGSIDKQTITIGDRLQYDVAVTLPAGFSLPEQERPAEWGLWSVKDVKVSPDRQDPAIRHLLYTLTTFTTGQVIIPELAIPYTDDKDQRAAVSVASTTVMVESVLAKAVVTGDIRDIKPPLSLPVPLGVYLLWLLILAAAGTAAFFWYRSYRRRQAAAFPEPEVPAVPPHVMAIEELEKLKNAGLVQEGRIKEFYIALSDIIRVYIAAVYGVTTMDRTTAEIYAELRQREQDKKRLLAVKDFFDACDLVKFARYRPDEATCWQDWEAAKQLIKI